MRWTKPKSRLEMISPPATAVDEQLAYPRWRPSSQIRSRWIHQANSWSVRKREAPIESSGIPPVPQSGRVHPPHRARWHGVDPRWRIQEAQKLPQTAPPFQQSELATNPSDAICRALFEALLRVRPQITAISPDASRSQRDWLAAFATQIPPRYGLGRF